MHPTLAAPARIPLMLGVLLAVAACADQSTPTAPAAPPASSLGVNNGGNNRRILFASSRDEIGNVEIYSMNPDGSGLDRLTNVGRLRRPARVVARWQAGRVRQQPPRPER